MADQLLVAKRQTEESKTETVGSQTLHRNAQKLVQELSDRMEMVKLERDREERGTREEKDEYRKIING